MICGCSAGWIWRSPKPATDFAAYHLDEIIHPKKGNSNSGPPLKAADWLAFAGPVADAFGIPTCYVVGGVGGGRNAYYLSALLTE